MSKEIWQRAAIRSHARDGTDEVVAGLEGVLPGEIVTALLPSFGATREVAS